MLSCKICVKGIILQIKDSEHNKCLFSGSSKNISIIHVFHGALSRKTLPEIFIKTLRKVLSTSILVMKFSRKKKTFLTFLGAVFEK